MGSVDLSKMVDVVESLRQAKAEKAKWAEVEELMTEKIKTKMGNATEGTIDGFTVITWRPSTPAVTLDVKKLEQELPGEVLAPYRMVKAPARPFKLVSE